MVFFKCDENKLIRFKSGAFEQVFNKELAMLSEIDREIAKSVVCLAADCTSKLFLPLFDKISEFLFDWVQILVSKKMYQV